MKTDKTAADTLAELLSTYWKKRLDDEFRRLLAVAGSQPPLVFADQEISIRGAWENVESDSLHPRESADETCECGSGSNEVGPGHSSYCRRLGA